MKDPGQKAVVMLEEEGSLHSSKFFKEAIVFAWVEKSDKTLRICGKTPRISLIYKTAMGKPDNVLVPEEEESHAKEKRVRIQKEAINSSILLLTPTISKAPNSMVREVFVESSKESRLSNQMP